jgi:hypothetical protein
MPTWTPIPLDYEPWPKGSQVFVRAIDTFSAASLAKSTPASDTDRQQHFQELLKRIAWHLGSDTLPVFIDFNGDRRRMDKGCMGHAVASGFLMAPADASEGYVSAVALRHDNNMLKTPVP